MSNKTNGFSAATASWQAEQSGTEWTEPGQGATIADLWRATVKTDQDTHTPASLNLDRLAHAIAPSDDRPFAQTWLNRTNLRLTGAPLTADDLKRIAEAK